MKRNSDCRSYMGEECKICWLVPSYHNTLPHVNISAASRQLDVLSRERQLGMQFPCFRLLKEHYAQDIPDIPDVSCNDSAFVKYPFI